MTLPFFNQTLARGQEITADAIPALEQVDTILASEELRHEASIGNVTIALIRPSLEGNTLEGWPDSMAADEIEGQISGLGVMTKFAITFDPEAVNNFYVGQSKQAQLTLPPERYLSFSNRWEEFTALMTSGPSTALLLYSPNGDAIPRWRDQVGHFDIVNRRDPTNIRGRLGLDNYNNLIHGSDSIVSVHRELDILSSLLSKQSVNIELLNAQKNADQRIGRNMLTLLGINDPRDIKIMNDWQQSGEVYSIDFFVGDEHLIEKACIKFTPSAVVDEWMKRREVISNLDIATPALKVRKGATLIEEYIPFTLREAFISGDADTKHMLEAKFIATYRKIVNAGFRPISFHDVRSRGTDIVIIDFGEDLGGISPNSYLDPNKIEAKAHAEFQRLTS